jgi:hypothetical protein
MTSGPSQIYLGNITSINYFGNGVAAKVFIHLFIRESHSSIDDNSSILGWDAVLLGKYFLVLQRIAVLSSLGSRTD